MRSSGPEPENESSSFSPSFFLPPPPLDRVSLKESLSGARFPEKGREKERRREKLHHHHHPRPTGFTRIEKSLSYPPETRPAFREWNEFSYFPRGPPLRKLVINFPFPDIRGGEEIPGRIETERAETMARRDIFAKKKEKKRGILSRERISISLEIILPIH